MSMIINNGEQINLDKATKAQRVDDICEMVAEGLTLRQIAAKFDVNAGTILKWIGETDEFAQQYARARDSASDIFETDIIETAQAVSPETAAADRVKIDALKWVAGRRAPKRYGDRVQTEHSGSIQINDMSDEELERRIKAINQG